MTRTSSTSPTTEGSFEKDEAIAEEMRLALERDQNAFLMRVVTLEELSRIHEIIFSGSLLTERDEILIEKFPELLESDD